MFEDHNATEFDELTKRELFDEPEDIDPPDEDE